LQMSATTEERWKKEHYITKSPCRVIFGYIPKALVEEITTALIQRKIIHRDEFQTWSAFALDEKNKKTQMLKDVLTLSNPKNEAILQFALQVTESRFATFNTHHNRDNLRLKTMEKDPASLENIFEGIISNEGLLVTKKNDSVFFSFAENPNDSVKKKIEDKGNEIRRLGESVADENELMIILQERLKKIVEVQEYKQESPLFDHIKDWLKTEIKNSQTQIDEIGQKIEEEIKKADQSMIDLRFLQFFSEWQTNPP
jgi:hypothetical protein